MRGPWLYGLQPIRFESVYSQAQSSFKLVFKVVWWMCRLWGKRFNCLFPKFMSWENSKKMDRPLVIGYISPDFFTHSVSYFIEAPLVHHDYTNYQIVVYSAVVKADAKTHRFKETVLRRGGVWRDVYGIAEKRVADLVREDKVDILVELTGHTANNRLGVMSCRPAPVQVPPKTHLNGFQVKLSS
jgi:protein O-GlcNAc transferase